MRTQHTRGIGREERQNRKLPCPLLVDSACGVYAVRPQACRRFHSLSREACEAGGAVPSDVFSANIGALIHLLLVGALRSAGLPDASYELSDALARVLPDPGLEERWLAGQNVFDGLAADQTRTATDQAHLEHMTELIRSGGG
jgi:hypothetical protein